MGVHLRRSPSGCTYVDGAGRGCTATETATGASAALASEGSPYIAWSRAVRTTRRSRCYTTFLHVRDVQLGTVTLLTVPGSVRRSDSAPRIGHASCGVADSAGQGGLDRRQRSPRRRSRRRPAGIIRSNECVRELALHGGKVTQPTDTRSVGSCLSAQSLAYIGHPAHTRKDGRKGFQPGAGFQVHTSLRLVSRTTPGASWTRCATSRGLHCAPGLRGALQPGPDVRGLGRARPGD
jgi:hypothetical protein